MRWNGQRESTNVEDRRGMSTGGMVAGGGITSIVVLLIALLFGVDPSALLQQGGSEDGSGTATRRETSPAEDKQAQFTRLVLANTEDVWNDMFRSQLKKEYREPVLVLFSGGSQSGCGFASSATGPFYCPADQKVYIDLQFFHELETRFRAAGDFAQAYVVAHEIGHHVQNQLGILNQINSKQGRISKAEYNQLSVRSELQADFLAGVWANHAQKTNVVLEPGDLEEALRAANAIGDDRLQKQAQGYVVPDSFTHGTSAQRVRWFKLGFETGDLSRMNDLFRLNYNEL